MEGTVTDEWLIKEAGAEGKEVGKEGELRREGRRDYLFLPSFYLLAPDGGGTFFRVSGKILSQIVRTAWQP